MSGQVHLQQDQDVAFLVVDNPPVNAGSVAVREALLRHIDALENDPFVKAVVLCGAGKSFVAGSDLKEFDIPLRSPQLPEVIAAIESSTKPYVAALHGAALGGGYELALGCDARIAAPGTIVGLPECGLGIAPGAGGTQKLPRLMGKAKAIAIVCAGKRVTASQALQDGMIDAIAASDLRSEAAELARTLIGKKRSVYSLPVPAEEDAEIDTAARKAAAQGRNRPHILAAIALIRSVGSISAAEGLAREREAFQALRVSAEAKALRHVFFAERAAMRGSVTSQEKPRPVESFAVIGAGTMGSGIALTIMQSGYPVVLIDSDALALDRGKDRITGELNRSLEAGRISTETRDYQASLLRIGRDLADIAAADVVIEAVIEDIKVKQQVFAKISKYSKTGALLASNTSYLDIDEIAEASGRAEDVIGLHFFSPAHIMKLVEVVPGGASASDAVATGLRVAKLLGKQAVQAGNAFGFIGNRIYAAYRAACETLLEDGALPHEVDSSLEAFGFAMGPFAVGDMSGLDIAWRMRLARNATRDPRDRYVEIPDLLCQAGRFGRKTGRGYYHYTSDGKREVDPEVTRLIIAQSQLKGITRRVICAEEIQQRALWAIVNEAMLLLDEGVAARAGDIDVVLINGYGFPRWTGGPLHWALVQGREPMQKACRVAAQAMGAHRPVADLSRLWPHSAA